MLDRIKKIVRESGLSNGEFAAMIGVKPSSISHLLSGRNKPSLDFVLKLLKAFPQVSPSWLLFGEGSERNMPDDVVIGLQNKVEDEDEPPYGKEVMKSAGDNAGGSVTGIVFFYSDGSFREFKPRN